MFGFRCLVIAAVVVAGGATAYSIVDRSQRPIERTAPRSEPTMKPVVLVDPNPEIREAERARRAQPPVEPNRKKSYDRVLEGRKHDGTLPKLQPADPRPPTSCGSVEPVPKHPDGSYSGPHGVHHVTVSLFENQSGFGFSRMGFSRNDRGIYVASPGIDRAQLVSLLTEYEASVYVLDEMATPALARQAKRRPLDDFERLGLDAVRRGENLVWTREAPQRMFGAIRAKETCLECHANAKVGDLLGAFTYYLNTPVEKLGTKPGSK
jgi:hypothetical protein